jgi:hypothetical protein
MRVRGQDTNLLSCGERGRSSYEERQEGDLLGGQPALHAARRVEIGPRSEGIRGVKDIVYPDNVGYLVNNLYQHEEPQYGR